MTTQGSNPAVELGNVRSVLQLGVSGIVDSGSWTQADSDLFAHFLQVWKILAESSWNVAGDHLRYEGGRCVTDNLPGLEPVVFALVYFRQLVQDGLFGHVHETYQKHVDSPVKAAWLSAERTSFDDLLSAEPSFIEVQGRGIRSNRELFDAFSYGALIMHVPSRVRDKETLTNFEQLYRSERREMVRLALHWLLMSLMNHVAAAGRLMHQDYAHWLKTYGLPKPNVFWQIDMFARKGGET
jgi:hypothetical protein